jgi:anion transporter
MQYLIVSPWKERVLVELSTITFIILAIMMFLFITERIPIAVTAMGACIAFAIFGVVPIDSAFRGFGEDVVYLIVGMIIVGSALFETGVAQAIGKTIISFAGTNERTFILAVILVSVVFSLFMSNTATTSLMIPIATAAISASEGTLTKKGTYMIVGIAVCVGGGITLVGSTPQLIAQGFLINGGYEPMSFFEVGRFGIPVLILLLMFVMTFGLKLQKRVFDFPEVEDDSSKVANLDKSEENPTRKVTAKMLVSVGILIFCIIGFISGLWSLGLVAMSGAVMCVVTKCISLKKVFEKMDWTTVVIIGCSFGFAAALRDSGAASLIANGMIGLLGDNINLWLLCSAFALISMVLTNFMSSTASASILVPIFAIAAQQVGVDVRAAVMIVAVATNIGYATPVSTPPITMTLVGGYRFKDYLKVGGLFNVLAYFLVVALIPIILG